MALATLCSRRGMALPLALFALLIISALITAVFVVTRLEQKQGSTSIGTLQAFEAAETGLTQILATWNTTSYNGIAVDSTLSFAADTTGVGSGRQYISSLRKLNATTFLARSEGQLLNGTGSIRTRREVVRLYRLLIPVIDIDAAITTRTGMSVTGSSQISGVDSIPAGWGSSCAAAGPSVAGISDSSGNVTTSGACAGATCIAGSPPVQTDPTITSSTFTQFGALNFAMLAASANKVLSASVYNGIGPVPAVAVGGSCTTSTLTNWGAPRSPTTHPCFNYFPIIYHPGTVKLNGGVGQGILLVGGDLEVAGGFEFFGPAIVLGEFRSTGTGGHMYGGVMSQDANLTVSLLSGNSVVNYSSCALDRALRGSASARPLGGRGWAAVY